MRRDSQRVVWYEGMTLDPHHFQQWDRHQRRMVDARFHATRPYGYGLASITIDRDRLANGELVVQACTGVMPDGLVFDMPDRDVLPTPRNVQETFEATEERLRVYLTLPVEHQQGANVQLQGTERRRETRFVGESINVMDENTGANERRVQVARANFQLRFGGEPLEEYTRLPIAAVRRNPSGAFVLDDDFIPPCLRIGASETLMGIARRLLERLVTRSTSLRERQQHLAAQRELSPADVTALGLLGTVNTYVPLLKHHHAGASSHPEALFTTMLALAGQLSAYLPEAGVSARSLPTYEHDALSSCFQPLNQALLHMLGGVQPASNYVRLPLEKTRDHLYVATAEPTLLRRGQLFVMARADGRMEEELAEAVPRKLRLASPETIDGVISSYTRALPLRHTHRLPVGLPVDERASYFRLQKRGPFWEAIEAETALALFVPSDLSDLEVEVVAVHTGE